MKKIKQSTLIVIFVAVLIIAVGILALFNADDIGVKRELEMNAEFVIKYSDFEKTIGMQDMLDFEPVKFTAVMDTSVSEPEEVTFKGVELKTICEGLGIDISPAETFEVRALDGYSSALTADEVQSDGNVYICMYMNDEVLKPKSEGGYGPYMMVVKSSMFSQRWCKFVQEIEIR
ncbi:MAG: hypothetical protein BWY11_01457 [Firmicutes bacterium ADurb.Bin182]|nr:MAG: hypothetical protein BWY11_01457 [Firmicutes bacterium ADurb.Bin182]